MTERNPNVVYYYVDTDGNYKGGFCGGQSAWYWISPYWVEVPTPPPVHATQIWDGQAWLPYNPPPE